MCPGHEHEHKCSRPSYPKKIKSQYITKNTAHTNSGIAEGVDISRFCEMVDEVETLQHSH